jgi:putative secretion ATPase (PEP-CTERM system associated)
MYEKFYGFTEKPFALLPDPSFLYFGEKHSTAFAMLEFGLLNQAGFIVITGEVGSGKTTLIRHLLDQLEDDVSVGLVSSTHRGMGELLRWVLLAFGLDYAGKDKIELHDRFTQFLIQQYAQSKRTLLIIDEAQTLDASIMEELRLLSNINADKNQVLQIILVGQPELRELLQHPALLQFLQRVSIDYHLSGLSEQETTAYIHHRTRCAGRQEPVFSDAACSLIYLASKGIPRVINTLCDMVLVYGFVDQKQTMDTELVKSVLADKADSGLFQVDVPKEGEKPVQLEQSDSVKPVALKAKNDNEVEKPSKASVTQFDAESAKQLFSNYYGKKRQ